MQRILIDTDPGVDDALALFLALKSPELRVEAITSVSGNVHVEQATQNVLTILGALELDEVPIVAKGEAQPLVKPLVTAAHVHGEDGLGNISTLRKANGSPLYLPADTEISSTPGVALILEMARDYPDELVVVALGPLTNIAKAIRTDPVSMRRLRNIVVMGGAFEEYGNITTTAEFNIFVDPHAAQEVFDFGVPVHIVPLDATHQVVLTEERLHAEIAGQRDSVSQFLKDSTAACMEFYRQHVWPQSNLQANIETDGFYIHDALPIGILTHPAYFESIDAYVQVETEGDLTNGMTVADLREAPQPQQLKTRVCVKVEAETFLTLFFERIR